MSTKTTIKRIALVAVSALGLGVLTSVAPATAANVSSTVSSVTAGSVGPTRVGVATTVRFAIAHTAASSASDTIVVTATLTSKPSLSTGNVLDINDGSQSSVTLARLSGTTANSHANGTFASDPSAAASVVTGNMRVAYTATTTNYVDVVLTPDVAGSYTLLVSTGNTTFQAGDKSANITITTAGAPATATMSTIAPQIAKSGDNGSPIRVVLKDANGVVTKPDTYETINLTVTTGSATLSGAATVSLGASSFAAGYAVTNIKDTAAEDTVVVTLSGGGTLGSTTSLTTTLAMTSSKASNTVEDAASSPNVDWQQGTGAASTGFNLASQTSLVFPSSSTSQSIGLKGLKANGTASETTASDPKYVTVVITDTTGSITGVPGTAYDLVVAQAGAGATSTAAFSVPASLSAGHKYDVDLSSTAASALTGETTLTVTGETPKATTIGTISPAVVNSATGATNTFTSKIVDQFGVAIANAGITATISSGRNSTKPAASLASDANGYVTYSITDTGTTGTSDTVNFEFSSDGSGDKTATINYGVATVSTVTLTGGNTTAGVTSAVKTVNDIKAGDGAEAGAISVTATVKDANGALLAGLPITWSVAGSGVAITSTTKSGYTSATGTATAKVYAWTAGTYIVTASVGGKTATAELTFGQISNGEERTISASVTGNVVTAKAVDRFGNPVPNVTIYATQAGGVTINGKTRDSGTTDTTGQVDFLVSGSGDVTVSARSWAAAAGTFSSGQTCARKGALDCQTLAADDTAFTAYVAGTAIKDEVGVGSSFDAAGVSSATVSVAGATTSDSVDAANEATDAANAATDAANAAAEAADAATAAAQDAQAAVAALATQVASLIAGIKAQITTLTNLVIKIQKKVRA